MLLEGTSWSDNKKMLIKTISYQMNCFYLLFIYTDADYPTFRICWWVWSCWNVWEMGMWMLIGCQCNVYDIIFFISSIICSLFSSMFHFSLPLAEKTIVPFIKTSLPFIYKLSSLGLSLILRLWNNDSVANCHYFNFYGIMVVIYFANTFFKYL